MTARLRLLALVVPAMTACATPYHPVTAADVRVASARFPGTTRQTLEEGRRILLTHCTRCHRAIEPEAFRAEAWPGLVKEMSAPAGLDEREETLVVRYLVTAASAPEAL